MNLKKNEGVSLRQAVENASAFIKHEGLDKRDLCNFQSSLEEDGYFIVSKSLMHEVLCERELKDKLKAKTTLVDAMLEVWKEEQGALRLRSVPDQLRSVPDQLNLAEQENEKEVTHA